MGLILGGVRGMSWSDLVYEEFLGDYGSFKNNGF
jgi:hypothetical protein